MFYTREVLSCQHFSGVLLTTSPPVTGSSSRCAEVLRNARKQLAWFAILRPYQSKRRCVCAYMCECKWRYKCAFPVIRCIILQLGEGFNISDIWLRLFNILFVRRASLFSMHSHRVRIKSSRWLWNRGLVFKYYIGEYLQKRMSDNKIFHSRL